MGVGVYIPFGRVNYIYPKKHIYYQGDIMPDWKNFMTAEEFAEVEGRIREIFALEAKVRELKMQKMIKTNELMMTTAFGRLRPELKKALWADVKRRFKQ